MPVTSLSFFNPYPHPFNFTSKAASSNSHCHSFISVFASGKTEARRREEAESQLERRCAHQWCQSFLLNAAELSMLPHPFFLAELASLFQWWRPRELEALQLASLPKLSVFPSLSGFEGLMSDPFLPQTPTPTPKTHPREAEGTGLFHTLWF